MISAILLFNAAVVLAASLLLLWRHQDAPSVWPVAKSAALLLAFVLSILALIKVNYP